MDSSKAPTSSDDDPGTETGIPSVDQKLAQLDDDLNPIESEEGAETEAEPPKDKPDTEPKEDKPEKESTEDVEGYTIDEGFEDEAPLTADAATPEDQYIFDNIKNDAIIVRGRIGDSEEVKEFKVLAPEQLPRGFKFLDDYEASVASGAFNRLESKALQLQGQYRLDLQNKSNRDVVEREKRTDRADIARLQRNGTLPLIKASPDSEDFEIDPAVELIQKVMDFKDQLNSRYNQAYQDGEGYRHIGFEDAYFKYEREHPSEANLAQKKEDKARKDFARRTNRPNAGRNESTKPKVHAGMSSRDLDMYIESLDI